MTGVVTIAWRCRGCTVAEIDVDPNDLEALVVARETMKAAAAEHRATCPNANVHELLELWSPPASDVAGR